jgi:hypothetical protein
MTIHTCGAGKLFINELEKETNYKSLKIQIGKTVWSVTQAKGRSNYYSILKITSNPWGGAGRMFESLDSAIQSYKSIQFKSALMQLSF